MTMTRLLFRKVTSAAELRRVAGFAGKERLFTNSVDKGGGLCYENGDHSGT